MKKWSVILCLFISLSPIGSCAMDLNREKTIAIVISVGLLGTAYLAPSFYHTCWDACVSWLRGPIASKDIKRDSATLERKFQRKFNELAGLDHDNTDKYQYKICRQKCIVLLQQRLQQSEDCDFTLIANAFLDDFPLGFASSHNDIQDFDICMKKKI